MTHEREFRCSFKELTPIAKVLPHPRNPNTHPEPQIEKIIRVLRAHGWRSPLTVSTLSGYLIRGHGRLLAAQRLGLTEVPVDFQAYENETAELADLVADNEAAHGSEWDDPKLKSILSDIGTVAETGFSPQEIASLLEKPPVTVKPIDISQPPAYTWVLIGIPTERFGRIATTVENLGLVEGVEVHVSVANKPGDEDGNG